MVGISHLHPDHTSDLAALMRANDVPQFTVDGHRAGKA
jgi:ribonuclease BN (tRNA processing enzyme)